MLLTHLYQVSYIYVSQVDCGLTAPDSTESMTVGELVEAYNAGQLVEVPAPVDGSAVPSPVSEPLQLPPLACSSNAATDCYDAHWLCKDGDLSVAYPADEAIQSTSKHPLCHPHVPSNTNAPQ